MKRLIYCVLALVIIVSVFSGCDIQSMIISVPEVKYEVTDTCATVKEFPDESSVTEITIPDEYEGLPVTEVADFACVNHESITTITIGKNVEKIGVWAFANNQKLESFVVSEENEFFCSVNGVLFTKDMKTLLFYPPAKDVTVTTDENANEVRSSEYIIPQGVETIRTKAFYKCGLLTNITLPESLKSIEEKAFFRCSALNNFTLPEKVEFIGKDAFAYCTALTEITIAEAIAEIGDYAFFNCTNLLKINIMKAENEISLGEEWYPTNNGLDIESLVINWK